MNQKPPLHPSTLVGAGSHGSSTFVLFNPTSYQSCAILHLYYQGTGFSFLQSQHLLLSFFWLTAVSTEHPWGSDFQSLWYQWCWASFPRVWSPVCLLGGRKLLKFFIHFHVSCFCTCWALISILPGAQPQTRIFPLLWVAGPSDAVFFHFNTLSLFNPLLYCLYFKFHNKYMTLPDPHNGVFFLYFLLVW